MTAREVGGAIGRGLWRVACANALLSCALAAMFAFYLVMQWNEWQHERYLASPAGRAEQARTEAKSKAELDARMAQMDQEIALNSVKFWLRDPSSAQFTLVHSYHDKKGELITCGYVNSRNGFGGMSGAQEFVVIGYSAELAEMNAAGRRDIAKRCDS